jgi:uncharacterized protein (DUF934 family)
LKLLDRNGWKTSNLVPVPVEALGDGVAVAIPNTFHAADLLPIQDRLALVAIDFPKFSDGRGFSIARSLRAQGYRGTLRATGALIPDQFAFALHLGFDEVEISDQQALRQPVEQWLQALNLIHDSYQDGVDGSVSILRRRRQAAEAAA